MKNSFLLILLIYSGKILSIDTNADKLKTVTSKSYEAPRYSRMYASTISSMNSIDSPNDVTRKPFLDYSQTVSMNQENRSTGATTISNYILWKRESKWGNIQKLSEKDFENFNRIFGLKNYKKVEKKQRNIPGQDIHDDSKVMDEYKRSDYEGNPGDNDNDVGDNDNNVGDNDNDVGDNDTGDNDPVENGIRDNFMKLIDCFLDPSLMESDPPKYSEKELAFFRALVEDKIEQKIGEVKELLRSSKRYIPNYEKVKNIDLDMYKKRLLDALDDRIVKIRNQIIDHIPYVI